MTAEKLHRQALLLTLLGALCLAACAHLQPQPAVSQGIRGRVEFRQGDFEPPGMGHISHVRRKVLFYEKTDLDEVVDDGTFFSKIKTKRLASTWSNQEGYFEIELPVGEYSLFVIEEGKYYSNLFDGYGYIFPVTVEKDRVAEVRFVISYRAAI